MKFFSWEDRKKFLLKLSEIVCKEFSGRNFNVFVFGSFLRDDYDPDTSDLDLAVYADSTALTFDVVTFLERHLEELDIPFDILEIFTDQYDAYVVVDPLGTNVTFTDYFPEELREYFYIVRNRAIWRREEEEYILKVAKCVAESKYELGLRE